MAPLAPRKYKVWKLEHWLIALWIFPLSGVFTLALGAHLAPFRTAPLHMNWGKGFSVHHFLSQDCGCSTRILNHLLSRKAVGQTREVVHLIHGGKTTIQDLKAAGFEVEETRAEDAARAGLNALPQLLVAQNGKLAYQGAYGPDQQHAHTYQDLFILESIRRGKGVAPFTVFGCANGKINQAHADLLGLKYQGTQNE